MREEYMAPEMEVVEFETEDVITGSTNMLAWYEFTDED